MKKVLLLFVVLLSSTIAFTDDKDKDGWFDHDIDNMSYEMKKEFVSMYIDAKKAMLKAKAKVVGLGDKLAAAVENKANDVEKNKHIQDIANEIVTASDDVRKGFKNLTADGKAFDVWTIHEFSDKNARKTHSKLFSGNEIDELYDILKSAGVSALSKKDIKNLYGNEIDRVNLELQISYYRYLGFWLAGITTGKEFATARNAYVNAIVNEIQLVSKIYSAEIAKLDKKQIANVTKERKKETKEELEKINKKSEKLDRKATNELKK